MVAKFNSKTHLKNTFIDFFEPFRPRLTSKFEKSTNIKKILQKCNIDIKNAEFYADFEFAE